MADEILEQSLDLLRYHFWPQHGDRSVMDVFNRLLAKNIKAPGWRPSDHTPFTMLQIRSRRERRTTEELAKFPKAHNRDDPINKECPIIVAVLDGVERLLDGHNRINYWQKVGDDGPHDVNVHIIDKFVQ